jgi:hypothetical protein
MESFSFPVAVLALVAMFMAAPGAQAEPSTGASSAAGSSAGSTGGDGGGAGGGPPPRFGRPGTNGVASCGGALELPPPPAFRDAGDAVKALSRATQRYIKQCECVTQACIADALDQYAEALAKVAPGLPPQLQDLPAVVARAARRVRAARTPAAAVGALHEAIAVIHKDISLIRAEDPDFPRETRGGDFVAETLDVASLALERGGAI